MRPMKIVFSEDGRDFQRRGWAELVEADPSGTFFHTPDYLKLYWEEFGERPEHLLLAFAEEDDGAQVGAVAFERIGGILRFLGGTEVTDYMGPVGPWWSGGRREGAVGGAPSVGGLGLCGPPGAARRPSLAAAARGGRRGAGPRVESRWIRTASHRSWRYPGVGRLSRVLPAKLRHEIRRKAKKLEAEAGPVRIVRRPGTLAGSSIASSSCTG